MQPGEAALLFAPTIAMVNIFDITAGAFPSILCPFTGILALFIGRLIWLKGKKTKKVPAK